MFVIYWLLSLNYADENQRFASGQWNRLETNLRGFPLKVGSASGWLHAVLLLIKLPTSNRVEENCSNSALTTPTWWFFKKYFVLLLFENRRLGNPSGGFLQLHIQSCFKKLLFWESSGALWPWGWPRRGCDAGGSSGRQLTCSRPLHSGQKPELLWKEKKIMGKKEQNGWF